MRPLIGLTKMDYTKFINNISSPEYASIRYLKILLFISRRIKDKPILRDVPDRETKILCTKLNFTTNPKFKLIVFNSSNRAFGQFFGVYLHNKLSISLGFLRSLAII